MVEARVARGLRLPCRAAPKGDAVPNDEMTRYWNESAGPVWTTHAERLDAQLAALGARARAAARLREGERVIDVGCGCGATTLELADAVGESGRVVAVDISEPMLARASARAAQAGLAERIEFRLDDAQTAAFPGGGADVVFSRFGVMFFADPVAAFANLRAALRPGGRLAFVCWQAREKNPWMMVPAFAAAKHVAFPPPPATDAPGPFAFADRERVSAIVCDAGFRDVAFDAVEAPLRLGGDTLDEALELFLAVGPVGAALREANAGEEQHARVREAVREALAQFQTPRGLEAPSAAWIVTATRPSRE
jgi:SAM-dependent methyltransferase